MSEFIVSARKYRPTSFDTVVGQRSITTTLENAIRNNQLAHAYLFCGPRGVGKTSCARIFARTINQENTSDDRDFSFNIFELDAASNNKVEDIRQLIDQVRIQPQIGRYKVYIIDEVHMLSKAAFNAFLKTLEEPPKHAIFILATTEKHKILPTILSRCQIYDFNRITTKDIAEHLAYIADKEGVKADKEALFLLAQKADGALRDALSIFDQIVSFNANEISYDGVLENLNILDYDYYFRISYLLQENNRSELFLIVDEILANGFELNHFASGLSQHFRDLLVCKDESTLKLLEVSDQLRQKYFEQSKALDAKYLLNGLHFLNEAEIQLKTSSNPRIVVELTLMKIANMFSKSVEKKNAQPSYERNVSVMPKVKETELPKPQISDKELIEGAVEHSSEAPNMDRSNEQSMIEQLSQEKPNTAPEKKQFETTVKSAKILRPKNAISLNIEEVDIEKPSMVMEQSSDYSSENSATSESVAINPDLLLEEWKVFGNELQTKGKFNLATYFLNNQPHVESNEVVIEVDNKVLEAAIHEEKMELLKHLREGLNEPGLELKCKLSEGQERPAEIGSKQRFEKMKQSNPLLDEFQKQFDLGLE